jgi:hypothetical protein
VKRTRPGQGAFEEVALKREPCADRGEASGGTGPEAKDSQDGARSGLAAATTASAVVSVTPAESADPVHMVARSHKDVSIH